MPKSQIGHFPDLMHFFCGSTPPGIPSHFARPPASAPHLMVPLPGVNTTSTTSRDGIVKGQIQYKVTILLQTSWWHTILSVVVDRKRNFPFLLKAEREDLKKLVSADIPKEPKGAVSTGRGYFNRKSLFSTKGGISAGICLNFGRNSS